MTMKNTANLSLGDYQLALDTEKLERLRECEEHAVWAVNVLNDIADEIIRVGADCETVTIDHRKYIGWIRDLQELRSDYLFLRDIDIAYNGEIPTKE